MMRRLISLSPRRKGLAMATVVATIVVAIPCAQSAGALAPVEVARSGRLTLTAHLHYVDANGSYLLEEGSASGSLAGRARARVRITADISGSFTFYPYRGGSISGYGSAKLNESGTHVSFGGTLKVLGGTGRYAHARGHGWLGGKFDRGTPRLELTIQTTGSLSY